MGHDGVESILENKAGFYSQLFFLINHAIYAKTNMLAFKIKSDKWLFKYKDGWCDYFENYMLNSNTNAFFAGKTHNHILINVPLSNYKEMLQYIYRYNSLYAYTNMI